LSLLCFLHNHHFRLYSKKLGGIVLLIFIFSNMLYGLIGYPLSHSFSKKYFTEKFVREGIQARYELFELPSIADFPTLLAQNPAISGLNVTIPHKQAIIPYLTRLAPSANKVGAVNVIKIEKDGTLTGHNSDYVGFRVTLEAFLAGKKPHALVLGNGGAGKAVEAVLKDLNLAYTTVARSAPITFEMLTPEIMDNHALVINTTPLGMYPDTDTLPALPYTAFTKAHLAYDLVYNPEKTPFLAQAEARGAKIHNGLAMLHTQAEEAWRIFAE
jgi:shikimate dehydrogenase